MSFIEDLWLTKFVKFILASYGNRFKEAHAGYKERVKGGCSSLIALEKFVRSTFLYWVLLPFIVILALPIIVVLLVVTLVHGVFRLLIWLGITVKCMLSALSLALEALALYIIASLLWWFFKCTRPMTLDLLWSAAVTLCNDGLILLVACANAFVWYIRLISPCWISWISVATTTRQSFMYACIACLFIGVIIALAAALNGSIDTPLGGALLCIGFIMMLLSLPIAFVGGTTPDYQVHDVHVIGEADCDVRNCIVNMSDGVQYAGNEETIMKLVHTKNASVTLDIVKADVYLCRNRARSYSDGCGTLGYQITPLWLSGFHDAPVS